jgi:hypothetical protein
MLVETFMRSVKDEIILYGTFDEIYGDHIYGCLQIDN